jgi:propionyl-CoA synthetase
LPRGETIGNLALRLPLPPGCAPTLWGNDVRFRRSYLEAFPGWYRTGDAGRVDAQADVWVMGRTDDIMNVAGHRFSSAAMEAVLASHPAVAECAVVGMADDIKGHVPIGFVVQRVDAELELPALKEELVTLMRNRIGAVAAFRQVCVVPKLPKTRSGKVLRAALRTLADGGTPEIPPTIEDPGVLDEIHALVKSIDL